MEGIASLPGYTEKYWIETPEEARIYLTRKIPKWLYSPEDFFIRDRRIVDRGIAYAEIGLNPAGRIAELMGSECLAVWSIEERELLHELLSFEQKTLIEQTKQLLNHNIGPYFAVLGEEYITPPLHGARDFYDFNVIYDKPVIDLIHNANGYMHIHSHGPLKNVLPYFAEMGADVLHPVEPPPMGDVTIKEAKKIFRDRVCIEGNIQIGDMYEKSAEEIKEHVHSLIRDGFDDHKGLIVCPTASPFVTQMSRNAFDNYAAMIENIVTYNK